jgi:hypothetical protein
MPELRNNASSHDSQPTHRASELVAQADLILARYPADVREQITDLVRVLAENPVEAGKAVR